MLESIMLKIDSPNNTKDHNIPQILFPINKHSTILFLSFLLSAVIVYLQLVTIYAFVDTKGDLMVHPMRAFAYVMVWPIFITFFGLGFMGDAARYIQTRPKEMNKKIKFLLIPSFMSPVLILVTEVITIIALNIIFGKKSIPYKFASEIKDFMCSIVIVLANWPMLYLTIQYSIQIWNQQMKSILEEQAAKESEAQEESKTVPISPKKQAIKT